MKTIKINGYKTVGEYVRLNRLAKKIDQQVIAKNAKLSRQTLTNIEAGKTDAGFYKVLRVLQFLKKVGVPPLDIYLLEGSGFTSSPPTSMKKT